LVFSHSAIGHLHRIPERKSAADALLQSIDLALEAERLGMDGAYFVFITSRGN
jgi:hypothetical protein